jgi:(2Fe-2S) ferredoxin
MHAPDPASNSPLAAAPRPEQSATSGAAQAATGPQPVVSGLSMDAERDLAKAGLLGPCQHLLLMCGDEEKAKCASAKAMRRTWKALKQGAKQLRREHGMAVAAVRSQCFGVCKAGPLVGQLPQGQWHGRCDEEQVDQIIKALAQAERPPLSHE